MVLNFSPTTTSQIWNLLDISSYTPVNACEVRAAVTMWGSWTQCTAGLMPEAGNTVYGAGVIFSAANEFLQFERGANRRLKWMGHASSTSGTVQVSVRGYRLER